MVEVCVVLFIMAVIFIVAAVPASHMMEEEKLRRPIRELQSFAKTARRDAMLQDKTYEVLLLNTGFVLRTATPGNLQAAKSASYDLPAGVTYAIKRVGDKDFKKQTDARWVFSPNGLCEPVTFIFQRKKDWIRFGVDPLTAAIRNQESFIE
jgi:Tfp pilus assembly protein FimT